MRLPRPMDDKIHHERHLRFVVDDGTTLNALCTRGAHADVGAPVIVMVHGFAGNAGHWVPVMRELESRHDCLALELRGHGRSGASALASYSPTRFASDVAQVIDALEREVILAGHSLGAEAALLATAECRRSVRGLVLVDMNPDMAPEVAEWIRSAAADMPRRFRRLEDVVDVLSEVFPLAPTALHDLARRSVRLSVDAQAGEAVLELLVDAAMAARNAPIWDADLRAGRAKSMWAVLRDLSAPLLVVRGRLSSVLAHEAAARMTAAASRGEACTLSGGHSVILDNPQGVACALRAFVSRCEALRLAV